MSKNISIKVQRPITQPITKEELLQHIQMRLDQEFPTGITAEDSRITVDVDVEHQSMKNE